MIKKMSIIFLCLIILSCSTMMDDQYAYRLEFSGGSPVVPMWNGFSERKIYINSGGESYMDVDTYKEKNGVFDAERKKITIYPTNSQLQEIFSYINPERRESLIYKKWRNECKHMNSKTPCIIRPRLVGIHSYFLKLHYKNKSYDVPINSDDVADSAEKMRTNLIALLRSIK